MGLTFYKFPSIGQFRDCIKEINFKSSASNEKLPTLKFEGTVKLHGTHADIVYNNKEKGQPLLYSQSRNRVLTLTGDNCEFDKFVNENNHQIKKLFEPLILKYPDQHIFILHGEWCGGNIQKGVSLTQLEKMFVIYNISLIFESYKGDTSDNISIEEKSKMYEYNLIKDMKNEDIRIYNIYMFQTFNIEINFENPKLVQNELIELTNKVEKECPIGTYFGVSGIGEGIVWKCHQKNYYSSSFWFKCKGDLHSVTKVKTLAPVDTEKLKNISEFIDNTVTEERLQQGISYLREFNLEIDKKNMGTFVKWVVSDILKEESDTIKDNNFDVKKINKDISGKCYKWFLRQI
jgi:hypothetical protein